MEHDTNSISIPISEYRRLAALDGLESKGELIKISKEIINTQKTDLERYKKKAALLDTQLRRTQKQLDIFLNRGAHPRPDSIADNDDDDLQAREPSGTCVQRPTDNILAQIGNLPTKQSLLSPQSQSTHRQKHEKSNKRTSEAPGVSIVLLKKLVQDNLRLKERVQELENGINKQSEKSGSTPSLERIPSGKTTSENPRRRPELDSRLLACYQEENSKLKKELEEKNRYISQLHGRVASTENSEHLEQKLGESNDARKLLTEKLRNVQDTLEKTRTQLQEARNERDRIKRNYEEYLRLYPHPKSPSTVTGPQLYSRPAQPVYSTRPHPVSRLDRSGGNTSPIPAQRRRPVPPPQSAPVRIPSESSSDSTFGKCPRCDKPFDTKEEYGNHIKQCLKR